MEKIYFFYFKGFLKWKKIFYIRSSEYTHNLKKVKNKENKKGMYRSIGVENPGVQMILATT